MSDPVTKPLGFELAKKSCIPWPSIAERFRALTLDHHRRGIRRRCGASSRSHSSDACCRTWSCERGTSHKPHGVWGTGHRRWHFGELHDSDLPWVMLVAVVVSASIWSSGVKRSRVARAEGHLNVSATLPDGNGPRTRANLVDP